MCAAAALGLPRASATSACDKPELDAGDDGFALLGAQAFHRGFVAVQRLAADGFLQRRGVVTGQIHVERPDGPRRFDERAMSRTAFHSVVQT